VPSFESNSFSVYGIIGTTLEKTLSSSDGNTYRVSVTYRADADIPPGAVLEVSEVTQGDAVGGIRYEDYVAYTESALDMKEGSAAYIRLFNIKIADREDPDTKYQPAEGSSVDVRIELADASEENDLSVVHFGDGEEEGSVVETAQGMSDAGRILSFSAESFSVFVIVNHEGDEEIVTPRVEFHFIDPSYTDETDQETGAVSYTAEAYEFVNKHGEYQTTQILQDGEGLEKINNPQNIIIDNQDGTTSEKYFYG
jgi:hypothetical protein